MEKNQNNFARRNVQPLYVCHGHFSNPCGRLIRCGFDSAIYLCKSLLICGFLFFLTLCECAANPVTATSNQQSKQGQAIAPPTSAAGEIQNNTAKRDQNTTPRHNAFESMKAFFGHNIYAMPS
jgi:hypothetical protein